MILIMEGGLNMDKAPEQNNDLESRIIHYLKKIGIPLYTAACLTFGAYEFHQINRSLYNNDPVGYGWYYEGLVRNPRPREPIMLKGKSLSAKTIQANYGSPIKWKRGARWGIAGLWGLALTGIVFSPLAVYFDDKSKNK